MTNAASTQQIRLDANQESLRLDVADVCSRLETLDRGEEVADLPSSIHAQRSDLRRADTDNGIRVMLTARPQHL